MAQAKYEIRRKCPICGAVFQIRTIDATYCSKQCSDIAYKRKKDREAKEAKYEPIRATVKMRSAQSVAAMMTTWKKEAKVIQCKTKKVLLWQINTIP